MIALSYIISSLAVICLMGAGANVCKNLVLGSDNVILFVLVYVGKWRVME